jgi:hypothetical protein
MPTKTKSSKAKKSPPQAAEKKAPAVIDIPDPFTAAGDLMFGWAFDGPTENPPTARGDADESDDDGDEGEGKEQDEGGSRQQAGAVTINFSGLFQRTPKPRAQSAPATGKAGKGEAKGKQDEDEDDGKGD